MESVKRKKRTDWMSVRSFFGLFQLLVQIAEEVGAEEGLNGDVKAVAQLFDGGNCGAAIAAADDIVHRGLGDAAQRAQFVDGNIPFPA